MCFYRVDHYCINKYRVKKHLNQHENYCKCLIDDFINNSFLTQTHIQILFLAFLSLVLAENGKKRSLIFHHPEDIISNHLPAAQSHFEQTANGFYKFSYKSPDGSQREEAGSGVGGSVMQGSYAYISPDGTPVQVSYVADHNGFRPIGNVISPEVQQSYYPEVPRLHEHAIHERNEEQYAREKRVTHENVLRRSHRD